MILAPTTMALTYTHRETRCLDERIEGLSSGKTYQKKSKETWLSDRGKADKANERLRKRFCKMTLNKRLNRNAAATLIAREPLNLKLCPCAPGMEHKK